MMSDILSRISRKENVVWILSIAFSGVFGYSMIVSGLGREWAALSLNSTLFFMGASFVVSENRIFSSLHNNSKTHLAVSLLRALSVGCLILYAAQRFLT